ncbi:hypothetical protein ACGFNU_11175 [Spirillospora sp. NPDC048911]|uniref:hypothetical protein n=1 Tax=Spirillospora sp. NPDC048911 TaxID=3364527 RepID=UPI00370FEA82
MTADSAHATRKAPSIDGRRFRAVADVAGGEIVPETLFTYHESDGEIWAEYAGGAIRRGHLVGTRTGDMLDFRYSQLNAEGETNNGHCASAISVLPDGRLRLDETWEWESKPGSGVSAVEEVAEGF